MKSHVDYTLVFRELSTIPTQISELETCFYTKLTGELESEWPAWLDHWQQLLNADLTTKQLSLKMKQVNPKYTWREWLIVPAYEQARKGDYSLIKELQEVLAQPYQEQSMEIEQKYYKLRPLEFFNAGGVSHYSCSS